MIKSAQDERRGRKKPSNETKRVNEMLYQHLSSEEAARKINKARCPVYIYIEETGIEVKAVKSALQNQLLSTRYRDLKWNIEAYKHGWYLFR